MPSDLPSPPDRPSVLLLAIYEQCFYDKLAPVSRMIRNLLVVQYRIRKEPSAYMPLSIALEGAAKFSQRMR